ncbi:cyclin-dependent kinase inhibitor 3 [Quercus suber]|uniref:Cyclin-dependent kinase inhibitor 3 n=1 Tax=Quercus suber TaxID=58331 RepID=A0AAW0M9I7_QUESU
MQCCIMIYIIYWCFAYRSSSRESTPCSLIRDADSIGITPGSTTRRTSTETNRRVRNIPTTQEMEEFFARAEQEHQRIFIDKYNFDFVSDLPLPGRYEWVQIIP